jgi:preprotein translocase subunit Sec61beta
VTASVILPACVLLLLLYAGLVRVLERREPSELALDPGAVLAVAGTAGGVLLFSLVMAAFFALGVAHLRSWSWP